MHLVPIKKNGVEISQLPIYSTMVVTSELMGARETQADIDLPGVLLSPIGSSIEYRGQKFTVNTPPLKVEKLSNRLFKYSVMFESVLYRLYDKQLKHLKNKTFQYYGAPLNYAQLIVDNINEIDSGWNVGICDTLPEIKIDFSGQSCRNALDVVAEKFTCEWFLSGVEGKTISFVKQVGSVTSLVFQYGMGKGLYSLSYQYQSDKNIVTRATGYGSIKNLPEGYRGSAKQLMFDGEYLDKNVFMPDGVTKLYDVREGDYENPEIYPEINGLVSAFSAYDDESDIFEISASTLDFNLNDYFSVEIPKLSFKSGELQGQDFEIKKYNHTTKTITLKVFQDSNDNKLPNTVFQPAIGDTFTLFDMHLPAEVVAAAELRLKVATQAWLNENCVPRVLYSLEMDPLYARDNNIMLYPGDQIRIIDTDLGIDEMIRVTKTVYPYQFPDVITPDTKIICEIANFIPYTRTERVISDTIDNKNEIKYVDRTNTERARMNSRSLNQLSSRVFDPDGNLAKGDETLFAAMAKFGFDSQNYGLIDVTISPNVAANANALTITGGHLVHNIYEIEGLGYDWVMAPGSWAGLDPLKFYYVYAKCSKTALTGTWEISETPVFVNDIAGHWAFNLGQLNQVNVKGYRTFDPTKGVTTIVGGQITSGIIQDISGQNYINLTIGSINFGSAPEGRGFRYNKDGDGELMINGKVIFGAGSTGYENIDDKPDLSGLASQDFVNAVKDDLQNQIDGQITAWFYNYVPDNTNLPASTWTTDAVRDTHLGDLFYDNTTGYAYRYMKDGSVFSWFRIMDTDVVLALQTAQNAQDTADGKRRVFVVTPTTPYDVGDLWSQGPSGELMKCIIARATGSYSATDWGKASKYTDDTIVNALITTLGDMAYEDAVEFAKLGTTIIEGGYLKNSLIETALLIAQNVKTSTSGLRIEISGANNNMIFYNADDVEVFRLDDDIDSDSAGTPLGGIRMKTPDGQVSYGTGNGFFANGSGLIFIPLITGISSNGSVVGLLQKRNTDPSGLSAAVVGIDQTDSGDGPSKSYGGYFNTLKASSKLEVGSGGIVSEGGIIANLAGAAGDAAVRIDASGNLYRA
ncbi:phage tail protein [Pedobacter metabolipauper]|uniref:Uncharacterized protein n=1 Tax=Pedobacter metabolipauper TaxID=425513 RepID=A0A4R6T178_9SPHI|nr:phage tail protein [Pedobacter metabolipauper]TDQ12157.1 hypothetical protein ATK78_1289 [Pedobacter metabolipauper]